jgi:hypothetical protein
MSKPALVVNLFLLDNERTNCYEMNLKQCLHTVFTQTVAREPQRQQAVSSLTSLFSDLVKVISLIPPTPSWLVLN